jgi:Tol biopolymer transport system component
MVVPVGTLVFASNRGGAYAIFGLQTDGRRLSRLTEGPGDSRQPASGRDGLLAYVTETADGQSTIRRVMAGGIETAVLPGVDPAWSRDGERLAFASSQGDVSQVLVTDGEADAPTQVTKEQTYAGQPTWSPDGQELAYVVERDGNWDIWATALAGGEARQLTKDPAMDWAPAWSPDGKWLAFVSDRDGHHQIYVMRANGTDVRLLTGLSEDVESPSWSSDGFWLAFVAYTGDGVGINAREIHLVRSDGQYPLRLTQNSSDDTEVDWVRVP